MRRVVIVSHTYVSPANRGKLRALAARGIDVTVGVPQRWIEPGLGVPLDISWQRSGAIEIFPIPVRRPGDAARATFGGRELKALLRDKRPDVVQVEEEPTALWARQVVKAARRLGLPTTLFTSDNVPRHVPWRVAWRRRRTLRALAGLAAGSEAAAVLIRADHPDLPVAVLPQLGVAVPTSPEHRHHEGLAFGYVGRLVPGKGLDTLLEALARIRGEKWHLVVVGDGPDRERLETIASDLRLAARIRWAGALPAVELPRLWPDLDALIAPSLDSATWTEQAGHVLAEAMAHEVAVVGAGTGVIPEVIGDAGVVVPAGDPEALAAALVHLKDEIVRRALAVAARARALRHYSDDAVAERTVAFWNSVVK